MLGGAYAIVWGLVLAFVGWGAMTSRGPALPWIVPQQLLPQWVVGSLLVGGILLIGGARATGAALVGPSVASVVAYFPLGAAWDRMIGPHLARGGSPF